MKPSDQELLAELRRCAQEAGQDTISLRKFEEIGKCHSQSIYNRFGSWLAALELAGLQPSKVKGNAFSV